jgi:hypothetical protein
MAIFYGLSGGFLKGEKNFRGAIRYGNRIMSNDRKMEERERRRIEKRIGEIMNGA